jgi:hypothetical protein
MGVSRGPHTHREFGLPSKMPLAALTLQTIIDGEQLYGKRLEYSFGSRNRPT